MSVSVPWWTHPSVLGDLALARADGSYLKLLAGLSRTDLIIDDWGESLRLAR